MLALARRNPRCAERQQRGASALLVGRAMRKGGLKQFKRPPWLARQMFPNQDFCVFFVPEADRQLRPFAQSVRRGYSLGVVTPSHAVDFPLSHYLGPGGTGVRVLPIKIGVAAFSLYSRGVGLSRNVHGKRMQVAGLGCVSANRKWQVVLHQS